MKPGLQFQVLHKPRRGGACLYSIWEMDAAEGWGLRSSKLSRAVGSVGKGAEYISVRM